MIVLDELGDAADRGAVDIAAVTVLLENERCEFIITGHRPADIFMQRADYITEFNCVAHPYRTGVTARKGIEY